MNKKVVLGVFFLIIAAGIVSGAFYLKNYMMLSERSRKGPVTESADVESVFEIQFQFVDYKKAKVERSLLLPDSDTNLTIVHFWASWCEPCITEIPELLHFVKESEKNQKMKIKFIIVSLDENFEDLNRFLKNFPKLDEDPIVRIWDSSDTLSAKFAVDKLPATIFWKRSGEVKKVHGIVDWKSIQL